MRHLQKTNKQKKGADKDWRKVGYQSGLEATKGYEQHEKKNENRHWRKVMRNEVGSFIRVLRGGFVSLSDRRKHKKITKT